MNIIDAIYHLITNPIVELKSFYESKNRANQMGSALEEYIKDLFAGTLFYENEIERLERLSEVFSYLGNQNNPPDVILKQGDAIEIKKIEGKNSALALNSSYPKHKLFADSSLITEECRLCEEWQEKDIIYCVGVVSKQNTLQSLCMVYGVDYSAHHQVYEQIRHTIKDGILSIEHVEFAETNELGKVKRVDPLGITDLRVRGMWSIENPFKLFQYIYQRDEQKRFNFMCIINQEKYNSFDNVKRLEDCLGKIDGFNIQDVKIKNPNNPAQLKSAKLITFALV